MSEDELKRIKDQEHNEVRPKISRAARAEALLGDDMLQAAFADLESGLMDMWRKSSPDENEKREDCWRCLDLLSAVKKALTKHIDTGKLARRDLEELTRRREALEKH